jgi:hypothetical protein
MSTTVTITIARGRSVQVGNKLFGPGEDVAVPTEDLEGLRDGGFVHDPDGAVIIRTPMRPDENPLRIGLQYSTDLNVIRI